VAERQIAFGHGTAVVVEGAGAEEGGIRLVLDVFAWSDVDSVLCQSFADVRAALLRHGGSEDEAETTAMTLWQEAAAHVTEAPRSVDLGFRGIWWTRWRRRRKAIEALLDTLLEERPKCDINVAFGEGKAVVVDAAWLDGDALRLELEVFDFSGSDSLLCRTLDDIRNALLGHGTWEQHAERTALRLWEEHRDHLGGEPISP
jgi:hypothetical protein